MQIWSVTPDITSERAIAMFQEEIQREDMVNDREWGYSALTARGRLSKRPRTEGSRAKIGTNPECKKCGKEGHIESDCWVDMICENCQRKGHPARNY